MRTTLDAVAASYLKSKTLSPDREVKEMSRWGWLFYRRVKTGKTFYRPMNQAVHAHLRSILPPDP